MHVEKSVRVVSHQPSFISASCGLDGFHHPVNSLGGLHALALM
jgi:hypothetical protein